MVLGQWVAYLLRRHYCPNIQGVKCLRCFKFFCGTSFHKTLSVNLQGKKIAGQNWFNLHISEASKKALSSLRTQCCQVMGLKFSFTLQGKYSSPTSTEHWRIIPGDNRASRAVIAAILAPDLVCRGTDSLNNCSWDSQVATVHREEGELRSGHV